MGCPRAKQRKAVLNILVLAASLVIVASSMEVLLRITGIQKVPALNPPIYKTHENPEISYALIPSNRARAYGTTVTTNALGFRSPQLPVDERPVVMLGDSLVFGFGVKDNQTVGHYLQRHLPDEHVLSVGLSGYNITQERAVYKEQIAPLEPKALILVFMPNDMDEMFVLDDEGYFRSRSDKSGLSYMQKVEDELEGGLPIPFKAFLQTHSAVFTFLERTTKALPFRARTQKQSILKDYISETMLEKYAREFRTLSQAARTVPKLFVIWPEDNLHLSARPYLKELALQNGWEVLDLYGIFGNRYDSLGWDGHSSAKTNKKTAKVIAEAIEYYKLLE